MSDQTWLLAQSAAMHTESGSLHGVSGLDQWASLAVQVSVLACSCSDCQHVLLRCRFYQKLSGMTGTAKSAAAEFYEIYGLRVVPIPTNKPPRRKDMPLRLYYTDKVRHTHLAWGHSCAAY